MANFITDSLQVFNSSKTSSLARRVYVNLFSGMACVLCSSSLLSTISNIRLIQMLHLYSAIPVLVIPLALRFFLTRLSNAAAYAIFYLYTVSLGAFLAPVLLTYDMGKISLAFILTGLGFIYAVSQGVTRNFDISDIKSLRFLTIALMLMTILNLFLRLTLIELACCSLGIPLCIGLTSYLISQVNNFSFYRGPDLDRLSILLSLAILNNLVSLFLYILRILEIFSGGGRRGRN